MVDHSPHQFPPLPHGRGVVDPKREGRETWQEIIRQPEVVGKHFATVSEYLTTHVEVAQCVMDPPFFRLPSVKQANEINRALTCD